MQPWQGPGLIVPHCLMWCLWWERNSMCFEDNERSIPDLMLFFFRTLLDYLVVMWNQSFSSFLDILDSSNFCTVDPLYTSCVLGCSFFDINKSYYLSKTACIHKSRKHGKKLTVKCSVKNIYIYTYNCYSGNVQDMAGTLSRQGPKMVKEIEKKKEKKVGFFTTSHSLSCW